MLPGSAESRGFRCHWSRALNPTLMSGRHAATAAEAATHQPGRRHQPIVRLLVSRLLEQQEEWQLERRRFFSEASMDKIPDPEWPLELTCGRQSAQPAESTSLSAPDPHSIYTRHINR